MCARCPCGMHHGTARIAWDAGGGGWQLAGSLAFALAPVEGQGDGRCLGRRSTQVLRRGRGFAPEGTGSPGTGSPGGLGAPGRVLLREGAGSPVDGRSGNDRVTRGRTAGRGQGHGWTAGRRQDRPRTCQGHPWTDGRTDGRGQGRPSDAPCLQTAPPPPLCRLTSPRPDGSRGHRWYRRLCQARGFEKPITLEWRGLEGGSAMVGAVGNSAAHTKSVTQPALFRPPAAARRTAAHASSEGI